MLQYFYFYFIYFEAALFEPLDGAKLLVEVLQIPEDAREAVLVQSELVHQGQPFPEPPGEHFVLKGFVNIPTLICPAPVS